MERGLRLGVGRWRARLSAGGSCRRAQCRPSPVCYKVVDRPSAECGPDEGCSTAQPPHHTSSDARLALERLYGESPLDWSRGFFLVTLDGGEPPAERAVLASGPQQQQQKTPPDQRERSPDYYANVGDAIRTLREDIPQLFDRELNFSIYRDDIVFRDPRNSFQGIKNYKTIFWSLRFHGRIFFTKLYVEVKRIWQTEDGCIRMRWTVHGVPRVPWEAEGTFDGISQYKLDHEGRIYEHAVDNVILRDPPVGVLPWLYSINLNPVRQQAVPGAFFRPGGGGEAVAAAAGHSAAAVAAAVAAAAAAAAHAEEPGTERRRQRLAGGKQERQQDAQLRQQRPLLACSSGGVDEQLLHRHQEERQQQQGEQQQPQQQGWWSSLLARFSWVRLYAAIMATMQLLQQQHEQLRLQPAPVQQVCTERS